MLLKTVLFAFLATAVHAGPVEYLKNAAINWCNTNNATDKVEQVKILMDEYIECYREMIHVDRLPAEFLEAPKGTEDDVARRHCAKAAQTKTCLGKMNQAVSLCLKGDERDILFVTEATIRGIDYMCYVEDGKTRLAKFVVDGAFQCFASSPLNLSRCDIPASSGSKVKFQNMSRCVIDKLKACSNAAAIRLQGMADYILNERPSSGDNQLFGILNANNNNNVSFNLQY